MTTNAKKPLIRWWIKADILFVRFEGMHHTDFIRIREQLKRKFPQARWSNNDKGWALNPVDIQEIVFFAREHMGDNSLEYNEEIPIPKQLSLPLNWSSENQPKCIRRIKHG